MNHPALTSATAATTNTAIPTSPPLSAGLARMLRTLAQRRFFKLIGGGSLTEAEKVAWLARIYAQAGVHCIDIAPDPAVLASVTTELERLADNSPDRPARPVLMVSLPLDPDPHFRKIELVEPDCIRCGLCLPVCPTEALTLPEALEISQALCYGCGRCVPACPTDALKLLPFQVESQIEAVLSHPRVEALEIHSHYADPVMLQAFFERWKPLLGNKLISLCFRIDDIPPEQILAFYDIAVEHSRLPVILQVDGAPMSGGDDPEASRPALEAAVKVSELFASQGHALPPITISGGINVTTSEHLSNARYDFISGVGMGTVARKLVWSLQDAIAEQTATRIVSLFSRDNPTHYPV